MGVPPSTEALELRVRQILQELATLGDLRPGSLSRQYNVCGNPQCHCKADPPRKHGPYYQLSWTRHGKHHTQFVPREDVTQVRQQLRTYERQRALMEKWTDLALELSELKIKAQRK